MSAQRMTHRHETVLVVSDDDDLNLLLEFLLEADGFRAAISTTTEGVMQALLHLQPEAIFFDMNFQGGNRLNLLEFIQEAWPDISTFTVMRPELPSLQDQASCTKAQGLLVTPVDYRRVRTLLRGSRQPAGSCMHRRTSLDN